MATTSPPKSNNSPQNLSWKIFAAAVLIWVFLSLWLIAALYAHSERNSHHISYLTLEMRRRESAEVGLETSIEEFYTKMKRELRQQEQKTASQFAQMQIDLNNFQDFVKRSEVKQDEISKQLNLLSERFEEKEKELNGQEDFPSLKKQVEQMKDSFHSYVRSQDFFQVVNNMVDVYSKKFNQIYQELDEKNEIIQKLLQASQMKNDVQYQESMIKREELSRENILNEKNIQIAEITLEEEESFVHQVEAKIEDLKSKISHSVEETFEKMKDLTNSAQEKFEAVEDLIVNKASDSMNKLKELTQSAREKLNNLTNNQNEGSFEKVKEFAKSTEETLETIKDFVVTNAGQSAEKIKEVSKTAKEKIGPIKDKVSEQAQQMKESVQKIGKNLEEKAKGIAEKAKNFAKKFF